jgi:hypothetical protein
LPDVNQTASGVIPDRQKEDNNNLVFSYMTLRNLIGVSGMLLPLILILTTQRSAGDKRVEPSISDYYYTNNGDVLVVLLSVLGVFLFTYKGYGWKEQALTVLAAISGIGVAFSPTVAKYQRSAFSVHTTQEAVPMIFGIERHLVFAGLFFISLAVMSLVFFQKTDVVSLRESNGKHTPKAKRNFIFRVCGWTMLACVLILTVYFASESLQKAIGNFPFIFTIETIAVEAFGLSWLTKGETLWPDGEHYLIRGYRNIKHIL